MDGYQIHGCADCTHRFVDYRASGEHVATEFGDEYFTGGGVGYPDYLAEASLRYQHGRKYAALVRPHLSGRGDGSPPRMLDVGCAAGFLAKAFADGGWVVQGLEPNPAMAGHGREVLGLDIVPGSLETTALPLPAREAGYDLILMVQVVGHLFDLDQSFQAVAAALRPGGLVLIETWNCASYTARLMGTNWHEYSPPNTLHFFTPTSLDRQAAKCSWQFLKGGRPRKRILAGHARSLATHKYGKRALGRLLVGASRIFSDHTPLPYPAEDLMWRLYRSDGGSDAGPAAAD